MRMDVKGMTMTVRLFSFITLGALILIFLASSLSNLWSLMRSNQALDGVDKEIRVVLSCFQW